MATMYGRRGVDRRYKQSGSDVDPTAAIIVGDGSGDGSGSNFLDVHIGLTL